MGKWTALKDAYPEEAPEQSTYDRAVELARDAKIDDLTSIINETKQAKKDIESSLKATSGEIAIQELALRLVMMREKLDSVVSNGYRWTPSPEPYAKVVNRAALVAWISEHMPEAFTVHTGKLNSQVKHALDGTGGVIPDGVEVFMGTDISRTKQ